MNQLNLCDIEFTKLLIEDETPSLFDYFKVDVLYNNSLPLHDSGYLILQGFSSNII